MKKLCENVRCMQEFETEFVQREYCSQKCKRTAKNMRAASRDKARNVAISGGTATPIIHNPTVAQLSALVLVYAAGANPIPTLITGALPDGWQAPNGVEFSPQAGAEHTWLMKGKEFDIMEHV